MHVYVQLRIRIRQGIHTTFGMYGNRCPVSRQFAFTSLLAARLANALPERGDRRRRTGSVMAPMSTLRADDLA